MDLKTILGGFIVIVVGAIAAQYSREALYAVLAAALAIFVAVCWKDWFGDKHARAAISILLSTAAAVSVATVTWFGLETSDAAHTNVVVPPQPTTFVATAESLKQATEAGSEAAIRRVLRELQTAAPIAQEKAAPLSAAAAPVIERSTSLKRFVESRLGLMEFYPKYEWPLSGATTLAPAPLNGSTLTAPYTAGRDDYRLTVLVSNGASAEGIILSMPRISLRFPLGVGIREAKYWRVEDCENARCIRTFVPFGPVLTSPTGVNESLYLSFPESGDYPVRYSIEGIANDVAIRVDGAFTLSVVRP